jgi:hypothetical protein
MQKFLFPGMASKAQEQKKTIALSSLPLPVFIQQDGSCALPSPVRDGTLPPFHSCVDGLQ